MSRHRYSLGLIIILVGLVILLFNFNVFGFIGGLIWPLLAFLLPGLLLHYLFFARIVPSGVLVPGGILVTYSVMFFLCELFTWKLMTVLWPLFIFGVAVGMYEYYLFDRYKPKGALFSSIILTIVSAILFVLTLLYSINVLVIALALIVIGVLLMVRRPQR